MAVRRCTGFEADDTILQADGQTFTGTVTRSSAQKHQSLTTSAGGSYGLSINNGSTWRIIATGATAAENICVAVRRLTSGGCKIRFDTSGLTNCTVDVSGADGLVRLYSGDPAGSSTLLATSVAALAINTWYFLRVVVTAREAASSGRIQVFVNGDTTAFVDTGAGVDCRRQTVDDFDSVSIVASGATLHIDDYIQAATGTDLKDKPLFIQLLRPTSDGGTIEMTKSTGASNFGTVDEDPVSTADYNQATAAGREDHYGMGNLGSAPLDVICVRVMAHMTGEGAITLGRTLVESNGTTSRGTNQALATGGTYAVVADIFSLNPDGNVAWTGTSIDAMLTGQEAN